VKAVVTGVAGFIGSHLARKLLADGHQVIGIDALTDYYDVNVKKQNLADILDGDFSFYFGDINNIDLSAILNGAEWIFHQAGQPGVRQSWGSDFSIYVRENIAATQKLLEAAKACSTLRRLVYASSSSIYGNAERYPTSETARPQPSLQNTCVRCTPRISDCQRSPFAISPFMVLASGPIWPLHVSFVPRSLMR
jgi:UDP-glucuronate 4-epimerase